VARAHGAARVVLAVPVAPVGWEADMAGAADDLIALETPDPFGAIGRFYRNFSQTTDDEVVACLDGAGAVGVSGAADDPPVRDEEVEVQAGPVRLFGHLTIPASALGIVVFAHGSGSSRHSPRNRYVASVLNDSGVGTLLFDLLTSREEHDRANVFDIDLLARRLVDSSVWLRSRPDAAGLPIGYFGASTGAAAALWAATEPDANIAAVVSRGGRPDLAAPRLAQVSAPTLLIVGSLDTVVLDLNRRAWAEMHCDSQIAVVPGATHLFEEPGTLEAAAQLARDWFTMHLARATQALTGGAQ
jgi:putative phosphoribosyl transferase